MSLVTGTARTGEAAAVAAYTGEKARLARAYDYLILVLALFLFIGAFPSSCGADRGRLGLLGGLEGPAMVAASSPR